MVPHSWKWIKQQSHSYVLQYLSLSLIDMTVFVKMPKTLTHLSLWVFSLLWLLLSCHTIKTFLKYYDETCGAHVSLTTDAHNLTSWHVTGFKLSVAELWTFTGLKIVCFYTYLDLRGLVGNCFSWGVHAYSSPCRHHLPRCASISLPVWRLRSTNRSRKIRLRLSRRSRSYWIYDVCIWHSYLFIILTEKVFVT